MNINLCKWQHGFFPGNGTYFLDETGTFIVDETSLSTKRPFIILSTKQVSTKHPSTVFSQISTIHE